MGSEDFMASDKFDFGDFLAALEAKRAALDALIGSYRAALAIGALGGDVDMAAIATPPGHSGNKGGGQVELPQGALLGKSLPAAIHLLMQAARRKMATKEIVAALKDGGVESTSRNFDNTVNTALYRLKGAGTVLRFSDGWALTEFYPESLRRNIAAQTEGKKPAAKAKKRARGKKAAKLLALPPAAEDRAATG